MRHLVKRPQTLSDVDAMSRSELTDYCAQTDMRDPEEWRIWGAAYLRLVVMVFQLKGDAAEAERCESHYAELKRRDANP